MSPEFLVDEFESERAVRISRELFASAYNLSDLLHTERDLRIVIGHKKSDSLERVNDRSYSMLEVDDHYTINVEDYNDFEDELAAVLDDKKETPQIAHRLFVALGVAGAAMEEMLANNIPAAMKTHTHVEMLREFFASHDDIEEKFCEIFSEDGMQDRSEMTTILSDMRAISINGLRMRLCVLQDVPGVEDFLGVTKQELEEGAIEQIKKQYEMKADFHTDVVVIGMGQSAKKGDQLFFNSLPDWLIAAATPMRKEQFMHFFSPAWQKD